MKKSFFFVAFVALAVMCIRLGAQTGETPPRGPIHRRKASSVRRTMGRCIASREAPRRSRRRRSTIRSHRPTGIRTSIRRCRKSWRTDASRTCARAASATCRGPRSSRIIRRRRSSRRLHRRTGACVPRRPPQELRRQLDHDRAREGGDRRRNRIGGRLLRVAEAEAVASHRGSRHGADDVCRRRQHAVRDDRTGRKSRSASALSSCPKMRRKPSYATGTRASSRMFRRAASRRARSSR